MEYVKTIKIKKHDLTEGNKIAIELIDKLWEYELRNTIISFKEYIDLYNKVNDAFGEEGYRVAHCYTSDPDDEYISDVTLVKCNTEPIHLPKGTILSWYGKKSKKKLRGDFTKLIELYDSYRINLIVYDRHSVYENKYRYDYVCDGTEDFYINEYHRNDDDIVYVYMKSDHPFSIPVKSYKIM